MTSYTTVSLVVHVSYFTFTCLASFDIVLSWIKIFACVVQLFQSAV